MGRELIQMIAELTGLPQHIILPEIERIVLAANKNMDTLTVEDFRDVMAEYLQSVLLKAKSAEL